MNDRLVVIGEIARPHGLRGEVRVTPLTERPERFETVTECVLWDKAHDTREPRRITGVRRQGAAVLLSLAGCETVEAAGALIGCLVALPEAEAMPLPPGHFYPWQIEGCRVLTEAGQEVGRVTGVEDAPDEDICGASEGPRERLNPAQAEVV